MVRIAVCVFLVCLAAAPGEGGSVQRSFRAGAAAVDISPRQLPVIVSGSFLERTAEKVVEPLYARAVVLDDGATRLALVVVDSLFMPRRLIDQAKAAAEAATGIPATNMLIGATHTHSAPSVAGALGSRADEAYARFLPGKISEAIRNAARRLAPARIGWIVTDAPDHTHCRRWILRPDRIGRDPFGGQTVRAMMHPGYQNPDYIGPAGPVDTGLTLVAIQSPQGQPIAVVANYSMHYFGAPAVSPDYYGPFATALAERVRRGNQPPPVVMMSQGTSGDLHWMDYSRPRKSIGRETYARQLAEIAFQAYQNVDYHDWVPLAVRQTRLKLQRRVPDEQRLAWARQMVAAMGGRRPENRPEVYAREQIYLDQEPARELVLQAMRIGQLGIVAIPCEVFGITGLKIKIQSPLRPTFTVELANGAEGYIPPPEQHALGGYTTWPARSAGLEVEAEPKIVHAVLALLEELAGAPRRKPLQPAGRYVEAVLASRPVAYWRLDELAGPEAADATGHGHAARYEPGVAFFLEGPQRPGFCGEGVIHRAAHFAGGRLKAPVPDLGEAYSIECWFWNGLAADVRPVTGCLFACCRDAKLGIADDELAIGGTSDPATQGRLIFSGRPAPDRPLAGRHSLPVRTWHHVVFVRRGSQVSVYLDGRSEPELQGDVPGGRRGDNALLLFGGSAGGHARFEGKLAEISVYDRPLAPEEITAHYRAAGQRPF